MTHKSDDQLKRDVEDELLWDPKINATQIVVSVKKGAVSLRGAVDSYAEKWAAEEAAKRVSGVRDVAHDITVEVHSAHRQSDADIAVAVRHALLWDVFVPSTVTAKVSGGSVTLEGQVVGNHQRAAAERAIRYLGGIRHIYNAIVLRPEASSAQVKEQVVAALARQAAADAKSIHVAISGGKVTLTGHASSWQSIADATTAAWAAPGVTEVVDELQIEMALTN